MRHFEFAMLPLGAFRPMLGRMSLFSSDPAPAPDYTPLANASAESAKIMADLGNKQLDFNTRQYEENKPILDKIAQQQIDIGNQAATQGADYYDYMKTQQRPVEEALNADAMTAGSTARQEQMAGKAMADVRQGSTQQQNQLIRQGLRYGYSPTKLATMSSAAAAATGLSEASAANTAREKEISLGYAKKLDVAGLYRGLPGASTAAYNTSVNAGNSAGANTQAPGQSAEAGMAQGASTIGAGRSMYQNGLSTILNSQSSLYGAGMNASGEQNGAIVGAVGGIAVAI